MGLLQVYLEKVTNLVDKDHVGKSDPYVRFEVEEDHTLYDKDRGEKRSSKKKGESSPVYGEEFEFEIPTLLNVVLSCTVMDDDDAAGSDDEIGKCEIDLEHMGLTAGSSTKVVRKLENRFSQGSEIFLKIAYVSNIE